MSNKNGLQVGKMAGRILHRKDILYKKEIIVDIINMYLDECRKEVKTHRNCGLPTCNNSEHLEKLSFDTQQFGNLKRNGYILDDFEDEDYEEGEE